MRSTFNILFYVNKSKEKNGVVPVMGRVTINGTQSQFSCSRLPPNAASESNNLFCISDNQIRNCQSVQNMSVTTSKKTLLGKNLGKYSSRECSFGLFSSKIH